MSSQQLGRLKWENHKFKDSLSNLLSPCLRIKNKVRTTNILQLAQLETGGALGSGAGDLPSPLQGQVQSLEKTLQTWSGPPQLSLTFRA